ncbi:tensin-3-like [Myxocyprinus asiaticus]|uniref:tensin-3-like n=1 Tax=Myxocyprinus asiaticus TaxID=70543 RepID=UPI002221384B|nr:tensin-3-like [Myxocyprinus asiaticus]
MEEGYELDLTYVTERIIAVSFPQDCFEETYLRNLRDVTRMLKSKHADKYLVINLSERKQELNKMNPKTLDTGWPDFHAPPLDKICTICKAIENWLNADPLHVVVIHCRGGKGRIGVVISSFVHFTDVSASADQALDRFAMRKFYDDKVSALMSPSQKRYVWILNSLLSGLIKMNTNPLFLHCIIIYGIPNFDTAGVCQPYLKVYQGMQVVYTSALYHIGASHRDKICIALEPAQLLKGDIMVKCYHKSSPSVRDIIFRVQFHTGAVQAYSLMFQKEDMDHANKDARFPDYGKVELIFSDGPERIQGSEHWQNGPDVTVDYMTTDSLSKWDSYQNFCTAEVAPMQSPSPTLEKPSFRRSSSRGPTLSRAHQSASTTSSPDHTLSASSDSGLSSASLRTDCWPSLGIKVFQPSQQEKVELKRLLSGFGLDESSRGCTSMEPTLTAQQVLHDSAQLHMNGSSRPKERETDILDDEVLISRHDLHSVDSLGTLSSSYHKSSQNSLLSDGFGSPVRIEETSHHHTVAMEEYDRRACFAQRSITSPSLGVAPRHLFQHGCYSTQTWVHQQQLVAAQQYSYQPEEDCVEERFHNDTQEILPKVASDQNNSPSTLEMSQSQDNDNKHDEEFSSLTVDIDNSIHQLNQLILDLDPTFVPISTKSSSIKRTGGADSNGNATGCENSSMSQRCDIQNDNSKERTRQLVSPAEDGLLILSRNSSGVTEHTGQCGRSPWSLDQQTADRQTYTAPMPQKQHAALYRTDSVEYRSQSAEMDGGTDVGSDMMPSTPAFPISPPTPYVKTMMNFSQYRQSPSPIIPSFGSYRPEHEMRAEADIMGRTPLPSDEGLQHPTHRTYHHSATIGGIMSFSDSSSSKPQLVHQSSLSAHPSDSMNFTHSSIPSHNPIPAPKAHSSPLSTQRAKVFQHALGHSTLQTFEEQFSFNPPVEGLNYHQQHPLSLEKRMPSDGENSQDSVSPAPSGFSSPHSGSSLSIPFPNVLPELQAKGNSISSSLPLPDVLSSKQLTVKFVQDTSKYWYKPDIARDQAIAVLKDKEPGSFIVRNSHSFRGAYGLAMKVTKPPPSALQQSKKGDLSNELVRHFLIECTQKGVRLKGCPNEPFFGSLTALVFQHSITSLALPCKLIIPDRDPLEDAVSTSSQSITNSAAELLKQGAACNVWFLGSVEMESLTGYQAVQKATSEILSTDPLPSSTVVHFKVSSQGITLTDNQRKLFFRRHYAVNTVIFCALDPQDRKWKRDGCNSAKVFGFVARKAGSAMENVCHLFAEHDPEQPASAIVNFVSKVMIGSQKI